LAPGTRQLGAEILKQRIECEFPFDAALMAALGGLTAHADERWQRPPNSSAAT
jgi:hypothetical protein